MKNATGAHHLAEQVVKARLRKGYSTQESLAKRVKVCSRLIGDLENGRRESYAKRTLQRLDNALSWENGTAQSILSGEITQPNISTDYSITQDIGGNQVLIGYLSQISQLSEEAQWEVRIPVPAEEINDLSDWEKAQIVNSAALAVHNCLTQRKTSHIPSDTPLPQ